jgi:hypothetical protein
MRQTVHERMADVERMYRDGLELKRQQLRRQNPDATPAEIEALLSDWLLSRPPDVSPARVRP